MFSCSAWARHTTWGFLGPSRGTDIKAQAPPLHTITFQSFSFQPYWFVINAALGPAAAGFMRRHSSWTLAADAQAPCDMPQAFSNSRSSGGS